MIGLDTNILIRFFTRDDEAQYQKVMLLLSQVGSFFVPDVVSVETGWVLKRVHKWSPLAILEGLNDLTKIKNLFFEDEKRVFAALNAMATGADLADELIVRFCQTKGCDSLATFDRGVVRNYPEFAKIPP